MGQRTTRILIADDHTLFREGLRHLLEVEPGFRVVGEAHEGEETVRLARQLKPEILLLDLAMPGLCGLSVLDALADSGAGIRTILLTAEIEKEQMSEALRRGARGIVLKASATETLFVSIRAVMAGEYWILHKGVADPANALGAVAGRRGSSFGLTSRELEIVEAVVAGLPNRDIARRFSISEQTVKHHLTNVFDKVGVYNRLELALFALHHGVASSSVRRQPPD